MTKRERYGQTDTDTETEKQIDKQIEKGKRRSDNQLEGKRG
jgi:hypothetical protein